MIQTKEFDVGKNDAVLSRRPSEVIARAVTNVESNGSRSPNTPLSDWIDPTALDRLFEPQYDGSERTGGHVSFVYENCLVTVVSSGEIYIHHGVIGPDRSAEKREENAVESKARNTTPSRFSTTIEAEEAVSQAVVAAVATAKGVEPTELRQQLYDIVEPDALNALFDVESDRSREPQGDISFVFDGGDVTVHSSGTITVESVFTRLREKGGNFLLVGNIPDEAFTAASTICFEPPFEARNPLLVFYGVSRATARDRVTQLQLEEADANAVVCDTEPNRPTSEPDSGRSQADSGRARDVRPVDAFPDSELEAEITERIDSAGTAHLYFDGVETLLERRPPEQVESILTAACTAVTATDGRGHYTLRASPGSDVTRRLAPLFDGVVELRSGERGIEQRWHLHESSYTTRWFGLE